jgi:hypothetical protein
MFNLACTVSPHRARIRSVFAPPQVLDEIFSRWDVLEACAFLVHAKKDIRAAGLWRGELLKLRSAPVDFNRRLLT